MEIFILFMRKVRKITVIFANLEKKNYLYYAVFQKRNSLLNYRDEFFGRKGITLISNYDKLIDLNNCIEDEKTVLLKAYEARVIYYN